MDFIKALSIDLGPGFVGSAFIPIWHYNLNVLQIPTSYYILILASVHPSLLVLCACKTLICCTNVSSVDRFF